ncbi:MAG: DUF2797 domain-containing protein [Candidatus ainarchaeum sp.]|nr:DUF2797 domain-containing protein [Candidatus ainarchaeum sp.]
MREAHLISFFSGTAPTLHFWEGGQLCTEEMRGFWSVSRTGDKACVGYADMGGRKCCPHGERGVMQCPLCRFKDIAKVHTRLDFTGYEEVAEQFLNRPYSIYLVSFGDLVKCGVTKMERVRERVREQGADFFVELMRLENGKDAYEMEALLQQEYGFRNAVRNDTKLKLLGKENKEPIGKALALLKESVAFGEFVLDGANVEELGYNVPPSFEVADEIEGKITGAKGQLLFFENGSAKVVNMKKMGGEIARID